jgi:hypothetical protein
MYECFVNEAGERREVGLKSGEQKMAPVSTGTGTGGVRKHHQQLLVLPTLLLGPNVLIAHSSPRLMIAYHITI